MERGHKNSLFQFKQIWKFSPLSQILIICGLYVAMVILGYFEYQATGLLQGLEPQARLFFVPIYEEFIFRGVILSTLLKYLHVKKAIVYSSLLFGLWHLKNILVMPIESVFYQVFYTMLIFGPIAAYVTIKTKSIWPAVTLHYLNNLWAPISWIIWEGIFT